MERCESSAMGVSFRRTDEPTGLIRDPWHEGQSIRSPESMRSIERSASISAPRTESNRAISKVIFRFGTLPWPRQSWHHPWGELKLKRRGSSSSKERLQLGQLASVDNRTKRFSAVKSLTRPLPMVRAFEIPVLRAERFGSSEESATTTSISCSTKRSKRVKSFASLNCRSTRSVVYPCFFLPMPRFRCGSLFYRV